MDTPTYVVAELTPIPTNNMNDKSTDKEDFIIKFTRITAMLHSVFSSTNEDYNFTLRLRNAIVKELESDKDVLEHVLSSYSMTEKVCPYAVKELVNKVKEKV